MSKAFSIDDMIGASAKLDEMGAWEIERTAYLSDVRLDEMLASASHAAHGAVFVNELKAVRRGDQNQLCGFLVDKEGAPTTDSFIEFNGVKFEHRPIQ